MHWYLARQRGVPIDQEHQARAYVGAGSSSPGSSGSALPSSTWECLLSAFLGWSCNSKPPVLPPVRTGSFLLLLSGRLSMLASHLETTLRSASWSSSC